MIIIVPLAIGMAIMILSSHVAQSKPKFFMPMLIIGGLIAFFGTMGVASIQINDTEQRAKTCESMNGVMVNQDLCIQKPYKELNVD